ncbi:hypothetical protein RIF29_38516 [Crotalaria pallida]|uniref:CG-1 domain-containing protein n=1 Tax=Crotalaria pallida TaxID=3830 RepID=A0AAN9HP07_CROPI
MLKFFTGHIGLRCSDIQQLQFEAQHRWLRPAEICKILRNYRMSHITLEPHRDMMHIVFVHYLEVKYFSDCDYKEYSREMLHEEKN